MDVFGKSCYKSRSCLKIVPRPARPPTPPPASPGRRAEGGGSLGAMVFSSTIFIFLFLPLTLFFTFLARREYRNLVLLAASLLFYAWGEREYVILMLISVFFNYLFGLSVERARERGNAKRVIAVAAVFNLGLLGLFKYLNFLVANLNPLFRLAHLPPLEISAVHMPIGISFFTFHSLSYVIDIYRGKVRANRSLVDISLYISLFPQLVAGPIIRYHDIAAQLTERTVTVDSFAYGARRFIIGLGKKVLLANTLATAVDGVFAIPTAELRASHAWLGAVGYTLQIYFDFSGYSDMAIGLGRMFGFAFLENFNYPYVSRSVQEFWRRWHISLSNWFRDYLYIPLGGNRLSTPRMYANLFTVFLLTGLWHGASWTFVMWGLFHGTFLVIERLRLKEVLDRAPRAVGHLYALAVVIVGWVFFRADDFPRAVAVLKAMVGLGAGGGEFHPLQFYCTPDVALALVVGIVFSAPLFPSLQRLADAVEARLIRVPSQLRLGHALVPAGSLAFHASVFLLSVSSLASGTYNPFIYFRF